MKRIPGLLLSILILCAFLPPAPAAEEAPLVLGLLEIRGLDSLANLGAELSAATGNPTPKEMFSMMLYSALGTTPDAGIPPDSTVRAVAFRAGTAPVAWAVLLPVADDGSAYLAGLAQNGWKNGEETADGLLHFMPPAGASPLKDVYFLKRGETLVAAGSADDARRADAVRPSLPPILPAEGDVAVQIRPAALAAAYGPAFVEKMSSNFRGPQMPAEAAAMGTLYARAYLAVAKQIEECVLGVGVADGNLNLHTRVAPVPDTAFARWVATIQPPAAAANVVVLPDALAAEVLNLGDLQELLPAYFRFMDELTATFLPAGTDPAAIQKYMEAEKTCYAQLTGDCGFALLPPTPESPLRFAEYVALKDAAAIRGLLPDMVRGANEMMTTMTADPSAAAPFKLDLALGEPREYRGIAIDRLTYSFQIGGPLAAVWPASIPTKFAVELAWVPGGALAAFGDAALTETLVDRALDGGAAPLTALPAWQALYPEPEIRIVDAAHVALFDALRAYLALADASCGSQRAQQVPDSAGNLESASYVFDGIMTRIRFSLADLAAAGAKIQALKAQGRAGMAPPPAGLEPPVETEAPAVSEGDEAPAAAAAPVPEPAEPAAPEKAPMSE